MLKKFYLVPLNITIKLVAPELFFQSQDLARAEEIANNMYFRL